MGILDHLKPLKLEQHGTQQASEARGLLQNRGNMLSLPDRVMADGLLMSAEDFRRALLEKKSLLARIRLARRYDREATNARGTIETMLDSIPLGPLNRPTHS